MFVDNANKFLTIRDNSRMTLISTALTDSPSNDEQLVISIRGTAHEVRIPARPSTEWLQRNTSLERVKIWDADTDGYVYGPEINGVFADFLGREVKLVYKGPEKRIASGNAAPAVLGREERVFFPDVLPVLIANEASMQELNGRLNEKGAGDITVERFRPNIIVRGGEGGGLPGAWSEDRWKTVRIVDPDALAQAHGGGIAGMLFGGGSSQEGLVIDIQARCARCQVPNVDPETAEKDKHEPWDTLVSYRRVDAGIKWKPCFGMLGCPRGEGEVKVGMKFEVVEEVKGEHRYIKGF